MQWEESIFILLQKYIMKAELKQNRKFPKIVDERAQRYPVDKCDWYIRTKDVSEFTFHTIKTFFLNLFKGKTISYILMTNILNDIKEYHK